MGEIEQFWHNFTKHTNATNIKYKDAFQFGVKADWLAELVVSGEKTATTSGYIFYELEQEELPKVGEYYIVLNSKNQPVAVIQITTVEVLPMNEVSEEFALAEGEGDYEYWVDAHTTFLKDELKQYELAFSPNMLVVCERFIKVYPK